MKRTLSKIIINNINLNNKRVLNLRDKKIKIDAYRYEVQRVPLLPYEIVFYILELSYRSVLKDLNDYWNDNFLCYVPLLIDHRKLDELDSDSDSDSDWITARDGPMFNENHFRSLLSYDTSRYLDLKTEVDDWFLSRKKREDKGDKEKKPLNGEYLLECIRILKKKQTLYQSFKEQLTMLRSHYLSRYDEDYYIERGKEGYRMIGHINEKITHWIFDKKGNNKIYDAMFPRREIKATETMLKKV